MQRVMEHISGTLDSLQCRPKRRSMTSLDFVIKAKRAICRIEPDSLKVTFIIPDLYMVNGNECESLIRKVNSCHHVSRLMNLDGTAVSAIATFIADDYESLFGNVCRVVEDLEGLVEDFEDGI